MRFKDDTEEKPGKPRVYFIRMQSLSNTKKGWVVSNTVEQYRDGYDEFIERHPEMAEA